MALNCRNVSFDTTNESLKEHLSRFGDIALTIMCKFAGTEQPTGNAFVHFKDKESADKCLEELEVINSLIDKIQYLFIYLDFWPFH